MSVTEVRGDRAFDAAAGVASEVPQETLAFVALLRPGRRKPDALGVVELDSRSSMSSAGARANSASTMSPWRSPIAARR
jgi:hypothetical protein